MFRLCIQGSVLVGMLWFKYIHLHSFLSHLILGCFILTNTYRKVTYSCILPRSWWSSVKEVRCWTLWAHWTLPCVRHKWVLTWAPKLCCIRQQFPSCVASLVDKNKGIWDGLYSEFYPPFADSLVYLDWADFARHTMRPQLLAPTQKHGPSWYQSSKHSFEWRRPRKNRWLILSLSNLLKLSNYCIKRDSFSYLVVYTWTRWC